MALVNGLRRARRIKFPLMLAALAIAMIARPAFASTYAAYIPLDSSIYDELATLNDLGLADSYLSEIQPISRVEAARITVEAESKLSEMQNPNELARSIISELRLQLPDEVQWIEQDREDNLPTMFHPVDRVEGEYVLSEGKRRELNTTAENGAGIDYQEGTPLLPNNDGLSTDQGSNEILRWSGWGGVGGFITGYGEGALSGPLTDSPSQASRAQLLTGAMVVSLGNTAISFGQEETSWGVGYFNQLSQSNNGQPFPALRIQNIHPGHLPWIFRYLGLYRYQAFLGQLNSGRTFSRPWLSGHIITFRTLPSFEWGVEHTIMFGGSGNNNYGPGGFIGNLTGLSTGNSSQYNTNTRFGIFGKVYIKRLRDTQIYAEDLSEDFFQLGGNSSIKLPFKGPSYTAGIYVPRLTIDGRTTARFEYALTDKEYSVHSDSLYWTYNNALMGSSLGPGAWQANFEIDRWLNLQSRAGIDTFYTRRQAIALPFYSPPTRNTETGYGLALNFLHLPLEIAPLANSLGEMKARAGIEYVTDINYTNTDSFRALFQLSMSFNPSWGGLVWQ
ncbi:capsule assembly Wzi family protein [Candidatus Binatus sp.]|uniref:capsule assembly Wzi family protein n=1 Tax=Candidatus Binatus sp. TaxID=2811406 RepID=UPI003BAFA86C